MSVQGAIYAMLQAEITLTAIVSTRVYPNAARSGEAAYPYIVYTMNGRDRNYHLGGAAGLATSQAEFQIFTKGLGSEQQMITIQAAIEDAIDGTTGVFDTTDIKSARLTNEFTDSVAAIDGEDSQVNVGVMQYRIYHLE